MVINMRKVETSSPYTWIMEDFFKGRFIRTYKRTGFHGYKRYLSLKDIYSLLKTTNIKHPKFLRNRISYVDVEFIEGKNLDPDFDRNKLLNLFCNTLFELANVKYDGVLRYLPYKDNIGFYNDNIKNLVLVMDKLNNYQTLERIGLRKDMIVSLANIEIDNNRPMFFIHGDFNIGNIIERNNDYYIIDWELATIGDIAYEIGIHFVLVAYSEEQRDIIFERVSKTLNIDKNILIRDVNTYIRFEMTRRCFLKFNRAINLARRGKPFDNMLLDAYKYYSIICKDKLLLDDIRATLRDLYKG